MSAMLLNDFVVQGNERDISELMEQLYRDYWAADGKSVRRLRFSQRELRRR